jgi:hypothetical protein
VPAGSLRAKLDVEAFDIGDRPAAPRGQFQAVRIAIQAVQISALRVALRQAEFQQGVDGSVLMSGRVGPVDDVQ